MDLELLLADLDDRLRVAIRSFWLTRDAQQRKQIQSGQVNSGTRGAVTGGAHLVALERLVMDILQDAALPDLTIRIGKPILTADATTKKELSLPGYYRPEKKWDMIVLSRRQLVAAIEFKAQVGPSFGNNANNRAEEAIGSAEDIWKAYREQRFGNAPEPFLGYFFLLEDTPRVHMPVSNREPFFTVDPKFRGEERPRTSSREPLRYQGITYSARYEILCRRLKLERLYTATCLVLATKGAGTRITEPADDLSFRRFIVALVGHAQAFALSHSRVPKKRRGKRM